MTMFLVLGLLMVALSVPLALGIVKPNGFYGFRTPTTMSDPDIWYPVNAYAGRLLFCVGLAFSAASILFSSIPGLSVDEYALACVGVLAVGMIVVLVLAFAYVNKLKKQRTRR